MEMKQIDKARREIALMTIDIDYPKAENGRRQCTKYKPMPYYFAKGTGSWEHPIDMVEEIGDHDNYLEFQCKCCGHKWTEEMPD